MIERSRKGAKKRGIEFTITEADISPLPEYCPVVGIKLDYLSGGRKHSPNCASIDRVDNLLGYIPGNVEIISLRANSLKSNATVNEIRAILAYMERDEIATRLITEGRARLAYSRLPIVNGVKPCRKCGAYDRNTSGQCRPCRRRATQPKYSAQLTVSLPMLECAGNG